MAMESTTVFVGSIPFDATEQQVHEICSTVGPIKSLRLVNDRETGKFKGYGFCEYHDHAAAESAVRNLTGYEMSGRQLRVSHAEDHQQMRDGERADRWRGPPRGERDFRRPHPDDRRFPPGVELPGSKPVGAAAAASAASSMAAMLGGPPGAPGPSQGRVNSVLGGMSPLQLYDLMHQMRGFISANPAQARQTLINNPQLTKALFQAQILLGMVKPPPGVVLPSGPGAAAAAAVPAPAVVPASVAAAAAPVVAAGPAAAAQPVFSIAAGGVGGAPLQVIAIDGGAQGMQYSIVQPGTAHAPPAPAPTPAPMPAPTQPAAAPAALPSDQQAILAQVMSMSQAQIDALPEATRQQVMQVKQLLMAQQAAAAAPV